MHAIQLLKYVAADNCAKIEDNIKYKAQLTRVSRNYQKIHQKFKLKIKNFCFPENFAREINHQCNLI